MSTRPRRAAGPAPANTAKEASATTAARPRNSKAALGWPLKTRWWARQDSNLQPDRYERPALTIELQAPPRADRLSREQTAVPAPLTMLAVIRQCRAGDAGYLSRQGRGEQIEPHQLFGVTLSACGKLRLNLPKHPRIRPPCATSRFRPRPACRIRPGSLAWGCRRFRQAAQPAWDPLMLRRRPC